MYENVVVRRAKVEDTTTSGIYLSNPENAKEYAEGEVVSVGVGYRTKDGIKPLKVSVGDIVLYRKMVEISISDGGEELFLVSENEIFAIKQ